MADVSAARARIRFVLQRILVVVALLLLLRFFLVFFRASASAPFVALLLRLTDPLVWPFDRIFPPSLIHFSGSTFVFEAESLIALVVYWLLGRILISLIR